MLIYNWKQECFMGHVKIGGIGSCVSRDGFNSKFIKDYKNYYRCVFEQNNMSMVSLVSKPIGFKAKPMDGKITDFNKQILVTELTKSVWDSLAIYKPDFLILDFYPDVYFGFRTVKDSGSITNKDWIFKETGFYPQITTESPKNVINNFKEYISTWKNSVDIFMDKIQSDFKDIKIIVNKIHFTDEYYSNGDKVKISEEGIFRSVDVDYFNSVLDEFYNYFESNYQIRTIDYGGKEYLSDENHIWDPFYVHYEPQFYKDFTSKLITIILEELYKENKMLKSASLRSESEVNINLVRNSTFNLGKFFWTHWQDDFIIKSSEADSTGNKMVSVTVENKVDDYNRQIWSSPVVMSPIIHLEYTLSFDLKIENINKIDSFKAIFSIRTFNSIDKVFQKDSLWHKNVMLSDFSAVSDEWIRVDYTFTPKNGKFMKVGPYLFRNGSVSWRNIKLEVGKMATKWVPSYGDE
jgi:hypothetical protein